MTKRSEKAAATRKVMVAIARAAFAQKPYSDVTFRGLAEAAGVSTGAYFSNWDNKEALYLEVTGRRPPETVAPFVPQIVDFLAHVAIATAGTDHAHLGADAETLRKKIVGA